jgi:hypothetical protein
MVLLGIITFMGALYNVAGKRMRGKFIPIAIAHSLLFPFAYFGSGGEMTFISGYPYFEEAFILVAVLGTLYLIIQIIYQIMVEGDLKDIDMEEASLLKTMGVGVRDGMFHSSTFPRIFSYGLKSLSIAVLFWMIFVGKGNIFLFVLLFILAFSMLLLDEGLMGDRIWDHSATLRSMALMEVVSTFALVAAVAPMIGGILPALAVMVFNIAYFVLMNRYLWGTFIRPRV